MTATEPAAPGRWAGTWRRGRVLAGAAVSTALVLAAHGWVPNAIGNLGSLFETVLPWTGLAVVALLVAALLRRSALALVAVLLPAVVWGGLFGTRLFDHREPGGDLTVVSHNVNDENPDPAGTARVLAASGAQPVTLEERRKPEVQQ